MTTKKRTGSVGAQSVPEAAPEEKAADRDDIEESDTPADTENTGNSLHTEGPENSQDPVHEVEMPEPPEDILQAARLAPGHWFNMVDPTWSGDHAPPEWAVVGRWRSDADGEIVEWEHNDSYRPSPRALGMPEPTDPVDAAVQLAASGYGPAEDVPAALATIELAVLVQADGTPVSAASPDGTAVVPVFTSQTHMDAAGRLAFEVVPVAALVDRLPENHQLYLNPSAAVAMRVEPEPLREAIKAAANEQD